jgi:thiamine-phosphate pyrophosphorylase
VSIGRLCVITDTTVQSRYSHDELAALAVDGGADMIQLRDKAMGDRDFMETARRVREVCDRAGAMFIINDRIEVARICGADGVHVGRDDASVADARAALGEGAVVGATAGTLDDALAAEAAGASYVGFGHIFPTTSKRKPSPPVGLGMLERLCAAVPIPVLAIGGITADNARSCVDAGARGVAVIAAVCAAPDPRAAARAIRDALRA